MSKTNKKVILAIALFALGILAAAPYAGRLAPNAGTKVSVPAAAFIPFRNDFSYHNTGKYLSMEGSANGIFTAPVYLPGTKTVTQVNLYAEDESNDNLCVTLYLVSSVDGTEENMGSVCSSGNEAGVRTFSITNIDPDKVTPSKGLYIWANFPDQNVRLYGVRVFFQN